MSDAPLALWDDLRAAGFVRQVAAGDEVFHEGDTAEGAYVVLAGRCAVLEAGDAVALLEPGELFGEIGAFGSGVRSATVVAVDDTELLYLSLDELRQGFASSPALFWEALRLVVRRLGNVKQRQVADSDEHRALREVQRSLLPDLRDLAVTDGFTVSAVWEPCSYASGDYYDVVPIDQHRHLFVMADVMGHGAQTSLMMAIARAQVRELVRSCRRTDELLLRLDGYLRDNAPPRQGLSMVVAAFDARTRKLEYSVAGHPFPFLVRDGAVSTLPGRPGIVLALPFLVGTGYERYELALEAGDRLVFYTDGLFEVPLKAAAPAHLGINGLAALVGEVLAEADREAGLPWGVDPLAALLQRVAELDAAAAADDDRTAMLVTVR